MEPIFQITTMWVLFEVNLLPIIPNEYHTNIVVQNYFLAGGRGTFFSCIISENRENNYRPHPKDEEGTVFTGATVSVHAGGRVPQSLAPCPFVRFPSLWSQVQWVGGEEGGWVPLASGPFPGL